MKERPGKQTSCGVKKHKNRKEAIKEVKERSIQRERAIRERKEERGGGKEK